jgi:hypothetical protein
MHLHRITSGESCSQGHGESPLGPERYANQRAALDHLTEQLAYWENIKDQQADRMQTEH